MNTEQNGIKENHSRHLSRNDRQPRNEKPPRFQRDIQNSRQALESAGLPRNRGPERHSSLEHWTDEKNKSDRHYPRNDRPKDLSYPIATHQSDITFKKRDNNMQNRVGKGVSFSEFKENSAAQDTTDNNNQKRGKRENQIHNSENFCDRKARTISSEAFMVKSDQHFGVNDYQNPGRTDNFNAVPNGDTEHHQKGRRVGPIKSSGPTTIPSFDDKILYYNTGPKRRSGPIKPEKILEPSIHMEYGKSWRPGDECFALYWEDNKVCLYQMRRKINSKGSWITVNSCQQTLKSSNLVMLCLVPHRTVRASTDEEEEETYEQTLEFRRGGDGQPRRSTRPTQQFYQPPRARN
ncbi:TDRD3 protein, partial [Corythaeola cristata]|nr:TDRD3 protein [Corythaeola cristata]